MKDVALSEDQTSGQLIISYTVEALPAGGSAWVPFSGGVSVGSKHIDVAAGGPVAATTLRFSITADWGQSPGVTMRVRADGCKV